MNKKKLYIFDIDGTMIDGQSQFYLIFFLYKIKKINLSNLVIIFFWFIFYKLKIIKDPTKIIYYSYELFKLLSVSEVDLIMDDFFKKKLKFKLHKDVIKKIKDLKRNGDVVILLSNCIYPLAKKIGEYVNADYVVANKLEVINGVYTGVLSGCMVYGKNKVDSLKEFLKTNNIIFDQVYAYADHSSDRFLLDEVDFPYVVNPNREMSSLAKENNWGIITFK